MKVSIIIIGMLCLLLCSNKGIDNANNYHSIYSIDGVANLENSSTNAHWDYEDSQNISKGISENTSSGKKRRIQETNSIFSHEADSYCQWLPQIYKNDQSRINLFLIYHFSLALWQVFLQ